MKKSNKQSKEKRVMEKLYNVWMPKDLHEALKASKWKLEMDTSEIVRSAIVKYLDQNLDRETKNKFKTVFNK